MKNEKISTLGIALAVATFLGVIASEEATGHGRGRGDYYFSSPRFPSHGGGTWFCYPGYRQPRYVGPPPRGISPQYFGEGKRYQKRFYGRKLPKPPQKKRSGKEFPLSAYGYFNAEGIWIPFSQPPGAYR